MTVAEKSFLRQGEAGYASAISGFKINFTQEPQVVFAARETRDLVDAVRYARAHKLPLSVLSTGHGQIRANNGGVLVNVSALNGVRIDPVARTARVEAGATWGAVQGAAREHGLAGLAGDSASVGVAGFTLGGGMGWLGRKYGLACDSLLEVELVMADGQLRKVNAGNDPELFWALRGGGGGFGVVAALTFRLYPVPRVLAGQVVFPLEGAAEALRFYRRWVTTLPDEMTTTAALLRGPDIEAMPPFVRGRTALLVRFVHSGDPDAGADLLAPLRKLPGVIAEQVVETVPSELAALLGPPPGPMVAFGRGEQFDALSDEAIDALVAYAGQDNPAPRIVELRHLGGAIARQCYEASAYSQRDAVFLLNANALAPVPQLVEAAKAFAYGIKDVVRPFVTGRVAPNFLQGDEGAERDAAAYQGGNHARLQAVKRRVDPDNLFAFARTPGSR
ncbi:MAG TPA: FAD-binding oxidoreductase [Deinococcales bacterium]|nr:FAD-binding oxidoreductase [Deinococcales bacterium]